mgnify:CR=1 FL=1
MYKKLSKNTLIINILKILEKYSDKEHRLSQQDIIDLLKKDYDNAYKTMNAPFMESVLWAFKESYNKG